MNPLTVNAFIGSVHEGVTIDDTFGFNQLIGLALTYRSFDPTNLQGQTLPTEAANGFGDLGDVLTVQQPEAQQMLVNIFGSDLVSPTNPPPDAAGDPNPPPTITPTTRGAGKPEHAVGRVRERHHDADHDPAAFFQPHALLAGLSGAIRNRKAPVVPVNSQRICLQSREVRPGPRAGLGRNRPEGGPSPPPSVPS